MAMNDSSSVLSSTIFTDSARVAEASNNPQPMDIDSPLVLSAVAARRPNRSLYQVKADPTNDYDNIIAFLDDVSLTSMNNVCGRGVNHNKDGTCVHSLHHDRAILPTTIRGFRSMDLIPEILIPLIANIKSSSFKAWTSKTLRIDSGTNSFLVRSKHAFRLEDGTKIHWRGIQLPYEILEQIWSQISIHDVAKITGLLPGGALRDFLTAPDFVNIIAQAQWKWDSHLRPRPRNSIPSKCSPRVLNLLADRACQQCRTRKGKLYISFNARLCSHCRPSQICKFKEAWTILQCRLPNFQRDTLHTLLTLTRTSAFGSTFAAYSPFRQVYREELISYWQNDVILVADYAAKSLGSDGELSGLSSVFDSWAANRSEKLAAFNAMSESVKMWLTKFEMDLRNKHRTAVTAKRADLESKAALLTPAIHVCRLVKSKAWAAVSKDKEDEIHSITPAMWSYYRGLLDRELHELLALDVYEESYEHKDLLTTSCIELDFPTLHVRKSFLIRRQNTWKRFYRADWGYVSILWKFGFRSVRPLEGRYYAELLYRHLYVDHKDFQLSFGMGYPFPLPERHIPLWGPTPHMVLEGFLNHFMDYYAFNQASDSLAISSYISDYADIGHLYLGSPEFYEFVHRARNGHDAGATTLMPFTG